MMHRVIGALLVLGAAGWAAGDTIVLEPSADNTIFRDFNFPDRDYSNGAGDSVFCGRTFVHAEILQRGLLRFDLSDIPCGSTITSVTLTLWVRQAASPARVTPVALHRVRAGWGEGASSSPGGRGVEAEPGDATWTRRVFPGVPWSTPGGDFESVASAVTQVGGSATSAIWGPSGDIAADVAGWVRDPSTNFGWILVGDEQSPGTARRFASRESARELRPVLIVNFEPGACPACDPDVNADGVADQGDVDYLIDVIAGGPNPTNIDPDFNADGVADQGDIDGLINVVAGGMCP